ncbi:MAG: ABATE domain-containing protein [Anaerolineales bacterium]|jgi:predicted RNA-binding Zn ribbon-like protein
MFYLLHAHNSTYTPSAGHLSLDFTNTLEWRKRSEPIEYLSGYADLLLWGNIVGLLKKEEVESLLEQSHLIQDEVNAIYNRAITLREALYRMFSAIANTSQPALADVSVLNTELAIALSHRTIEWTDQGFQWGWEQANNHLDSLLWHVAASAAELLTSDLLERVGECQGIDCGWLFIDTSKNHSRRWCNMDSCGNRAKARRHYKRKQLVD